jgi:hypothetical protein
LIICTAWETPTAKIRNGTRTDRGSRPKPSSAQAPRVQGEAERAGEQEHQKGGADEGEGEEPGHALGPLGDVADRSGEAQDVDVGRFVDEPRADFGLQTTGHVEIVETLAGHRIALDQLGGDQGGGEVVGDQSTHQVGLEDVLSDAGEACRGGAESGGHDIAADEAALDHLDEADVRGEQGADGAPIDARKEEHGVAHLLQGLEEGRREDVAVPRPHGDQQPVGATELTAVVQIVGGVGVILWQKLVEAGVDP